VGEYDEIKGEESSVTRRKRGIFEKGEKIRVLKIECIYKIEVCNQ